MDLAGHARRCVDQGDVRVLEPGPAGSGGESNPGWTRTLQRTHPMTLLTTAHLKGVGCRPRFAFDFLTDEAKIGAATLRRPEHGGRTTWASSEGGDEHDAYLGSVETCSVGDAPDLGAIGP